MKKLRFIYEGYTYLLKYKLGLSKDKEFNNLVVGRYTICAKCEHKRKFIGTCDICGCYCKAKVSVYYDLDKDGKSVDGCPLKKW